MKHTERCNDALCFFRYGCSQDTWLLGVVHVLPGRALVSFDPANEWLLLDSATM